MKKLILLVLFLIPLFGISQARLGLSLNEIYQEFLPYTPKFEYPSDGPSFMHFQTERAIVMYYFDLNNICILTAIAPSTQGDLNYYVEQYNRQYVVVSPTNWKMYSENGAISDIDLVNNNGTTFFIWK
jgi:hypothetical protein